jgi:hypothetical protein
MHLSRGTPARNESKAFALTRHRLAVRLSGYRSDAVDVVIATLLVVAAALLAARHFAARLAGYRIEAMALAAVSSAAVSATLIGSGAPAERAEQPAAVQLAPEKAAALVAATSASPREIRAVGEEARLINASLPFSTAPVQAARSFEIRGDQLDHRRALLCLTQAVYYEAALEPLEGRRAVAQVVLNRMRHPAFPKSVCGVVYQGSQSPVCQFSFVCDGSLYRAPAPEAWREAMAVADAALRGYVETAVGSATHYHADYVAPRWAPMLTKITQLGAHIFYRWPGILGQRAAFIGRYIGEPQDPLALRPPLRELVPPGDVEQGVALADARPPIARTDNDTGGFLDVSKGWLLNIPGPHEVGRGPTQAVPVPQPTAPEPDTNDAVATAPVIASR